jgi:UPF0716 family protein affecting phage T7 exclusion
VRRRILPAMARIGCLVFLLAIGLLAVELYVYLVLAHWLHLHVESINGYLEPVVLMIVDGVIGVRVIQRSLAQVPFAMMSGKSGRLAVRALGGALLVFPGLATDVVGWLLILPGFNHLFGRLGDKIVAALMRQGLQRMFSGGKAPPGFAFPGMQPDERVRGAPKTYDTTAEKADEKLDGPRA